MPSRAVVFVAFVCLSLAAMEAWREWNAYQGEIKDAETQSFNLAQSLTQHADDTFTIVDTVLLDIVERVETDGISTTALSRLNGVLESRVAEQPRLRGLFVYDEAGHWLANSLKHFPESASNADREYFQHHATSLDLGPYLGPPIRSRTSGSWVVTVSRRLQHTDGSFAGVALATLDTRFFSDFYRKFNVGQDGSIVLIQTKGLSLARFPHDEAYVGRDLARTPLLLGLSATPEGVRHYTSPLDGVVRISGYKRADRFPVVVQVAVGRNEVLASWRNEAVYRGAAVAILILLVGATGFRFAGQVRRRHRAEVKLALSEANFRLMAENSSDMVSRVDADGRRSYVSPASRRLLGYEPAELVGISVNETIYPEDRPTFEAAFKKLLTGECKEVTTSFRCTHRNGSVIWIEAALRVAEDPLTGRPDGIVGVSRDITERKRLEAQLTELARTDGLTELANRRAFDEALALEVRRASRQSTALSLILIDVDRFKLYNDSFGHPAGDECLRLVAAALDGVVGRPGDLVARYGGEEFVFLLPATDASSAMTVAERARLAVEALAIPHAANQPSGIVTISVGIATGISTPAAGQIDQAWLVEAADEALYQAKSEGRNRSIAAPRRAFRGAPWQVA